MFQYKLFTTFLKTKAGQSILCFLKNKKCNLGISMLKEWIEKDNIVNAPTYNFIGQSCIEQLPYLLKKYPYIQKALVVTTEGMDRFPAFIDTVNIIKKATVEVETYTSLKANPSVKNVNEIVGKYKANNCNCLVAIGGGSAHDAVKAVGLAMANNKELMQYQGINATNKRAVLKIHVNTTAGTGAEVTNCIVITDTDTHRKFVIADKYLTPDITFNDPNMMLELPSSITAFTGVDALVHAIEAYLSNDYDVQAKVYALEAMHLIFKYLPIACHEPENVEARENMCYAQYLAGLAFNITSLGVIHALSHPLTANFGTPHGLANAMLLSNVLEYELRYDKVVKLLNRIAWSFHIKGTDARQNCKVFISKINSLLREINIPTNLEIKDHLTLTEDELDTLTEQAIIDFTQISNPIRFSRKELKDIYYYAMKGSK